MDLVSVIIPTYNRFELLNHCIKSVINGTYENVEVIVVNDCSTDPRYYNGELEKYSEMNMKMKIKIIHLPVNNRQKYNTPSAQGMTRQEGINVATGQWIAFLDDDDFYLPDKLSTHMAFIKEHNCLFSSTNMYNVVHNSIKLNGLDMIVKGIHHKNKSIPMIFTYELISRTNYVLNSTVIVHKSICDIVGSFLLIACEDYNYWLRILKHTPCYFLNLPLTYYSMNNPKHYSYDGSYRPLN